MRSKPIHLSQSELHQLVHYDQGTGVFTSLVARGCVKVGQVLGFIGVDRYCYIDISGRRYKRSRLAWLYVTGSDPGEMQVDHKSRVRGDDGFENLRLSTASQNQHNASLRKDNTCGHSGVNWHKPTDNWQARIRVNGKRINLGYFNDLNEAVTARKAAERKYFGDFAPS